MHINSYQCILCCSTMSDIKQPKRDLSPERKPEKKSFRHCALCDYSGSNTARCDECHRRVCVQCRMDGYTSHHQGNQWVLVSCCKCLFIAAEGIPIAWRRPEHCGKRYYKKWEKKEAKEIDAVYAELQRDEQ